MGIDIHGKTATVRMNLKLWSKMEEIAEANGFKGSLPSGNNGETVEKSVAVELGRAVLHWWESKSLQSREQPILEPWESTILAYALMLAVDGGECKHR